MLRNFLLTLHVVGAIAVFGSTFAFPFIGAMAQKPGAPIPWFLRLSEVIENKWVTPLAATLQPGTGAGLIIISRGAYNPFNSENLWLLIALIIYTTAFFFGLLVQSPTGKKALQMAEAQQFGPEFGGVMKRLQLGGNLLTVMLLAIIVLMVVKPGR